MMGDFTLVRRQRKKKTNYIYFTQFLSEFFSGSKIHQNAKNNNKLMQGLEPLGPECSLHSKICWYG